MKRGLTLPAVLAVTVLGAVAAVTGGTSCDGKSEPQADGPCETLFCISENSQVDAGPGADAAVCGQLICADEQCPTGCVGVG